MVTGVNVGGDVIMEVEVGKGKGDGVKVGKRLNVGRGGAVDSNWAAGADAGVLQALRIKIHARTGMWILFI